MSGQAELVWLNGILLPAHEARIDPADRGFTLGDGVFETMLAAQGTVPLLGRHLARMRHGAGVLGIGFDMTNAAFGQAVQELLATLERAQSVVRATLTRGRQKRGVLPAALGSPTLLISAGETPPIALAAHVIVATTTRRNAFSPLSRIKSLNYGDSILARREAASRGADDAILLDTRGRVAEASAANVFLRIGGRWLTPPVEDGALPGIARALLIEAGRAEIENIEADRLAEADAICLVNSLGLRRVATLEGRVLHQEEPSP